MRLPSLTPRPSRSPKPCLPPYPATERASRTGPLTRLSLTPASAAAASAAASTHPAAAPAHPAAAIASGVAAAAAIAVRAVVARAPRTFRAVGPVALKRAERRAVYLARPRRRLAHAFAQRRVPLPRPVVQHV